MTPVRHQRAVENRLREAVRQTVRVFKSAIFLALACWKCPAAPEPITG